MSGVKAVITMLAGILIAVMGVTSTAAQDATHAKIQTSMGDMIVELAPEAAPQTVANFLEYATSGHYDRTLFHRVVKGFVIQGGGYSTLYTERVLRDPIPYEGDNGLKNLRGTIAMARTSDPHSASAQFFINVKDNDFLDHSSETAQGWGYCVFGKVVEGMDTVNAIKEVATTSHGPHQDVPAEPVSITSASVVD